jgi:hypothetical protein
MKRPGMKQSTQAERFRRAARRLERSPVLPAGVWLRRAFDRITLADLYKSDAIEWARLHHRPPKYGYWMVNVVAPERDPYAPDLVDGAPSDPEVRGARILALCFAAAMADTGDLP